MVPVAAVPLIIALACTYLIRDFLLVYVMSVLPTRVELECAKQYLPQRIAVIGPPATEPALHSLGTFGSSVQEVALKAGESAVDCVWHVLESNPGLVVIRDVSHDAIELAHHFRKIGYFGVT